MTRRKQHWNTPPERGFALVVTVSLLVLLSLLAVGLLSLSAISLRTSQAQQHQKAARANARLALMTAIGQLQKHAGPDTRVTARADILDPDNPPILGVWKSWEGSDHEDSGTFAGRPTSPGDYGSEKKQRFLRWLVSGDPDDLEDSGNPPATGPGPSKQPLVGEHTVADGETDLQVHLDPVMVDDGRGAYAWWIGGENLKARLPQPYEEESDAGWASAAKSHTVADPSALDMDLLMSRPELAVKAVSLKQSDLVDDHSPEDVSREHFFDLSSVSTGLLTNTATGGWRKDLSLFTENHDRVGTSRLPLFRLTPTEDNSCSIPRNSADVRPDGGMLYPWARYRGTAGDPPIYQQGAAASWENLMNYALMYRRLRPAPPFYIPAAMESINGNAFNFIHKVRVMPVIARAQWVFSHYARPTGSGTYYPCILMTPVITMWNPYNVRLTNLGEFTVTISSSTAETPLPCVFNYTVAGTPGSSQYRSLTRGSVNYTAPPLADAPYLMYRLTGVSQMEPGATVVFSPSSGVAEASTAQLRLQPGYRSGTGHYFHLKDASGNRLTAPATSTITTKARFDNEFLDNGSRGVGIYLDLLNSRVPNDQRVLVYRMAYTRLVARQTYPELSNLARSASLSSESSNPTPFLSTMFGARMASNTHIPAKGFVQTSPLVNYTAMGDKDRVETTISRDYGGTAHPVNSPFDFSFVPHPPNSLLPNVATDHSGYIMTGFTSGDGLTRCIAAELPTQPLCSLAELQHWDLRYENPIPPFAFNLIGNSDASPLLPPDAVVNNGDASLTTNLQYDDSYCANHLLFDDWFFSSIAAGRTGSFGGTTSSSGSRNLLRERFLDFVQGTAPLPNRSYKPLPQDLSAAGRSTTLARQLYNDHVYSREGWRTIASRLEVEGMFNVNSTSVGAWRALLGHARNMQVPYFDADGSIQLSSETDHAVSRSSIAGDTEAGKPGASGETSVASQFTGYRTLDDNLLDELAEKIVEQVRLRGPFLSLSEFVNRQLSNDRNLALAGAVQTALNELDDLYSDIDGALAVVDPDKKYATATPPGGTTGYRFPEAAAGICIYGLPGWTRQADVIRPLAPILSARDDTFTIRAYGDARDANGRILARATCEAVVRRTRDYVDPADAADTADPPESPVNQTFGRRFEVVSFRWLSPNEI